MTRCRIKDISLANGALGVDISVEAPEPVVKRLPIAAWARAYRAAQVLYGSAATPADADPHLVEWDEVPLSEESLVLDDREDRINSTSDGHTAELYAGPVHFEVTVRGTPRDTAFVAADLLDYTWRALQVLADEAATIGAAEPLNVGVEWDGAPELRGDVAARVDGDAA